MRLIYAYPIEIKNEWSDLSSSEMMQQIFTWTDFWNNEGLQVGGTVGLMCASSPSWLILDAAIMACGGVTVPLFENIAVDHLKFQVEQANIKWICVDSAEGRFLVESMGAGVKVVMCGEKFPIAKEESFLEKEKKFQEKIKKIKANDLATIIYTSGSTGVPKGVELTHANILFQVNATQERFLVHHGAVGLSCLPLAHVFERMVLYFYVSRAVHIYFVDDIQNLGAYIKEVQPHVLTVVPRILEKIKLRIDEKISGMSFLMKRIFEAATQWAQDHPYPQKAPLRHRIIYKLLRKALGKRMQYLIVGGAALDPILANFYLNMGIPVYQGYGLTETSPVIAANFPGHNRPGTVGLAFSNVEVKIASDGEILTRGPHVMRAYHKNKEATAEVLDADGWLYTGDLGALADDGFLSITGRKKELCKLSTGKYVAPVYVEQLLQQHLLIDTAVVIADGRNFVTALLFISDLGWSGFCSEHEMDGLNDSEILTSFDFEGVINVILEDVNGGLNEWEKIKRYRCVREPLSIDQGTLTPTLKLRRQEIDTHYQSVIEELYK